MKIIPLQKRRREKGRRRARARNHIKIESRRECQET